MKFVSIALFSVFIEKYIFFNFKKGQNMKFGPDDCNQKEDVKIFKEKMDKSIPSEILNLIWECTQYRLKEENSRQDRFRERGHSYINYGLSMVAGFVACLVLLSNHDFIEIIKYGTNKTVLMLLIVVMIFFSIVVFASVLWVFYKSYLVLKIDKYVTWDPTDLGQIDLSRGENCSRYQRFLTKAAWHLIANNEEVNNKKAKLIQSGLFGLFIGSVVLAFLAAIPTITVMYIAYSN